MVSIPDWSRFQRGGMMGSSSMDDPDIAAADARVRYERSVEVEAVRRAEEKGYFTQLTAGEMVRRFSALPVRVAFDSNTKEPTDNGIHSVKHIKLRYCHVKSLGDIGRFMNVRILDLSENYLVHLEPLASLQFLLKLDVHSNQISLLPEAHFWDGLPLLEILFLHDNPIGRVETVHSLVASPSLSVLTLFDSPLSLKKNYRHHVVNTIWTLKAFDRHVISDEEIIEDAIFKGTKFAAMQKHFEVDVFSSNTKGASFEKDWENTLELIHRIDRTMAKYCPVLLIQKLIRGWITRRRFDLFLESRAWASITIQRQWRKYKGIPPPDLQSLPGPEHPHSLAKDSSLKGTTGVYGPTLTLVPSAPNPSATTTPRHSARQRPKRNIVVDLAKLHEGTFVGMDDMRITKGSCKMGLLSKKQPVKLRKKSPEPPKKRKLMSVKQFFGPVVRPNTPSNQNQRASLPDVRSIDGNIPTTSFRLTGYEPPKHTQYPLEELMLRNKMTGQDIRDLELDSHDKMALIRSVPTLEPRDPKVKDKFLYARLKGTMGLSLLAAVHHAYRDRERELKMAHKYENVLAQQEKQMVTRERVRLYQTERRLESLRDRDIDRKVLSDGHGQLQKADRDRKRQTQDKRARNQQIKERAKTDAAFTQEFRTQQTSVSKALLRHDRLAKREGELQRNVDKVSGLKDSSQEQKEIVNKFLEHRSLLRQTETSMARAALDARLVQETSGNIVESRKRVEQLKNRTQQVQKFYPLPQIPVSTGTEGVINNTPVRTMHSSSNNGPNTGSSNHLLSGAAGPIGTSNPHIRFAPL